jgi:pimeloyl-ACP methyl ester carboxylesterase
MGVINQKIVPKLSTKHLRTTALILLVSAAASAQEPKTGYAPVNGLKMYYEMHGNGDPVVLLHGSFMTITNNWTGMIAQLSKSRQVIAVEMQGHGRTADINRDFSYESLADDIAALLDYMKIKQADVLGYSMGGGVAMQVAIRHPDKVRKVVSISAVFRHDGWVKEALEAFPKMEAGMFKGSPIETEYKKLSPTPEQFETFVKRVVQMDIKPFDFGAEKLKATKAPMLFIHGDADGARLDYISEMFRLKGGEIHGDLRPRSESRLAILPNTTHVTLMDRLDVIVPMVNDFLNAQPQKKSARLKPGENEKLLLT